MIPFEHDGRCYMASKGRATYEEARKNCKSLNGTYDLVSIVSAVEHKFIAEIVHTLTFGWYWLGLKGYKENMSWSDGLTFDYGSDYKYPWTGNLKYRPKDDVSVMVDISS
jgi:hypothetical protein